jgi:hypothetical protein
VKRKLTTRNHAEEPQHRPQGVRPPGFLIEEEKGKPVKPSTISLCRCLSGRSV